MPQPFQPTKASPGSPEKIDILCARFDAHMPLHLAGDVTLKNMDDIITRFRTTTRGRPRAAFVGADGPRIFRLAVE